MRDFRTIQTTIMNTLLEDDLINNVFLSTAEVNGKHTQYWCVVLEIQSRTDYEDYSLYRYNMYFINKQAPQTAKADVDWNYSMGMLLAKNALKRLEDKDIMTQYPLNFQFATVRFADVCDCITLDVTLQVENEIDCE